MKRIVNMIYPERVWVPLSQDKLGFSAYRELEHADSAYIFFLRKDRVVVQ